MDTRSDYGKLALLAMTGVLLVWSLTACAPTMMTAQDQPGRMRESMPLGPNPPVLEDSFAVSSMPTGALWNVFVRGFDPDGDMSHLWVVVTQLGKRAQTEIIPLVGPDQRAFSGYITIYPRGAFFSPWENLRVEIRIRDKADHLSATREQDVQMGFQTREMLPPQWADASRHKMGTVLFDMENDDGDSHFGFGRRPR
jgi:hypothetical protein